MNQSAVEIRCLDDSFEVVVPEADEDSATRAASVLATFPRVSGTRVRVQQAVVDETLVDREDRIQICIKLVRELHIAGL